MSATLTSLPGSWRARASDLRRWAAAEGAATALELAANELDESLRSHNDDVLSLKEAAILTGYSEGHLGRLVREGRLQNAGRKNAPKLRRGDLPKRPKGMARGHRDGYDPVADARALLSRQGER